jgi:hypothetical protein
MKERAEHAIAKEHGAENYFAMFEIFRKPWPGPAGPMIERGPRGGRSVAGAFPISSIIL